VTVPNDAVVIKEDAIHSQIPASRSSDNLVSQLRGTAREEWEVGNRPTGGDLAFRERLHDTTAPELQPDAPGQPRVRKVNLKRRKTERTNPDFDDPDHSARRRSTRRKSHSYSRIFRRKLVRMLIAAVILLTLVAGWLAWNQYHQPTPQPSAKPEFVQLAPASANAPDGKRKLETRSMAEYGPALRETVQRFVSAATVDEILPLVRDRARVEPKIRAYYTPQRPWKPLEINNKFEPSDEFTVDGDFIVLQLVLANFDELPISLERRGDCFLVVG
jgi:hypothetical protein